MAVHDHKAPARPSAKPDGTLIPPPPDSRNANYLGKTQQAQALTTIDSIAVAVQTLANLLADSDAYANAQSHGLPVEPSRWPLTSVFSDGMAAAIHHLQQYAGMLGREHRVNA